jgi:hypothetical protein
VVRSIEASKAWAPQAQEQLKAVTATVAGEPRAAATRVAFLKNFLLREPIYRVGARRGDDAAGGDWQPLTRFCA